MLRYDPLPWLLKQEGIAAVRARCKLGLELDSDLQIVAKTVNLHHQQQTADGSFDDSLFKTLGVLNLLVDLDTSDAAPIIEQASNYLFAVLVSQPGYAIADRITQGSLNIPCDLGGMFGPYEKRNLQARIETGAREMNFLREFDPLLGPQSPVRSQKRSSYDRVGPSSCYAWGLVPLSLTIEVLCRAGYADDARLRPALNALLGAQRQSGGWCRNLAGHPTCSTYALRAITAHPTLKESKTCTRLITMLRGKVKGIKSYVALEALAHVEQQPAKDMIAALLALILPKQRRNGSFGTKHRIECTTAVLLAVRSLE